MKPHPLTKPAKGATSESNTKDMEIIRSMPHGPERDAAINDMISANIPLVFSKVNTYISLHPTVEFLSDDLVCEGLVAVTEAVHKLASLDTPDDGGNCTAFIANQIVWHTCRLVDNFERQRVPEGYKPLESSITDPVSVVDAWDLLLGACESPEDVIILKMRERGSTDQEIANRLDIPRRAVNFMRHEILQRYEALKQGSE